MIEVELSKHAIQQDHLECILTKCPGRHRCNPKSVFGILTSASFADYFAAEVASHLGGFASVLTRIGEHDRPQFMQVKSVF